MLVIGVTRDVLFAAMRWSCLPRRYSTTTLFLGTTLVGTRGTLRRLVQTVWGYYSVFFFQAEDGIRDIGVTGVQTCALPIFAGLDTSRGGHAATVRPRTAGGSSAGPSPRERVHSAGVLAIGEFSRLTHLSVRTLRRYHDAGLLEPATVDPASGYRYYDAEQIPTAQVIHRLRELDVPLSDVQRILRSPDPGTRAALVADHLERLESQLDRTRAAVASLRRLLRPEPPPLDVQLRAVPATTVAAVEDDVQHDDVLAWYAGAMAELDAVVDEPTGVPGGLYDNALFETGRGHLLVYRPTAEPPRSGRVHPVTLPAVELAVTTHVGEHDDIDVTYGELGAWVVANALAVAGPVRERYLVGPRDTAEPGAWRTEIGWPVFRVAPR